MSTKCRRCGPEKTQGGIVMFAMISLLAVFSAFGRVSEIDFHYWYDSQLPLPDGWTQYKLNKGVESGVWKGGGYFESRDGWLLSPVFGEDIRSVTLSVATSVPDPTRHLYLHPISNGITSELGLPVSPTLTRTYGEQEFSMVGYQARQFVLKFDAQGTDGNWGLIRIVVRYDDESTDDEVDPPRSWSLSDFAPKPGFRMADLTALQYAKPNTTNPWRNGVIVEGIHAFFDSDACTKIGVGNTSSTYSGLYVIATNDANGPIYALSMLGTSGSAMQLMLPIALDAERPVKRLSVGYRVWELSNGKSSALSFSCRALDDLKAMVADESAWTQVSNAVWETGDADAVRTVDLPAKDLRGAAFACMRWSVPKKSGSSIVGISDVCVSAEIRSSGFAVIVK